MNPKYAKRLTETRELRTTQGHVLPSDAADKLKSVSHDVTLRNAYILALRVNGWTLASIAEPLGITRERVRQIESNVDPVDAIRLVSSRTFPVPNVPTVTVEVTVGYERAEPNADTLARLKELQPLAQKVRYNHPQHRKEAEEYTALLWKAHSEQGVTIKHLSRLLGVTHGAIRFRLARYGYLPSEGKSKAYEKIKDKNRAS